MAVVVVAGPARCFRVCITVREGHIMLSSREDLLEGTQQISYLAYPVDVIEDRLLRLAKEAAQGAVPLPDFMTEVSLLVKDLRRCFRQVMEMKDRRDLSYTALQALQLAEMYCVWLYRKIHSEEMFFKKVHLEAKLRGMISEDAFSVYRTLLDAETREKEFRQKADAEISRQLLGDSSGAM
jgi:hypothetical protein